MKVSIKMAILLFVFSCNRDLHSSDSVAGRWLWVKAESFAGTRTPANTSKSAEIELMNNSTYAIHGDFLGNETGVYSLSTNSSTHQVILTLISQNNTQRIALLNEKKDSLQLMPPGVTNDSWVCYFVKK